jgi:hypothetical protein
MHESVYGTSGTWRTANVLRKQYHRRSVPQSACARKAGRDCETGRLRQLHFLVRSSAKRRGHRWHRAIRECRGGDQCGLRVVCPRAARRAFRRPRPACTENLNPHIIVVESAKDRGCVPLVGGVLSMSCKAGRGAIPVRQTAHDILEQSSRGRKPRIVQDPVFRPTARALSRDTLLS